MFSEGQGATAVLFQTATGPRREIHRRRVVAGGGGGGGGGREGESSTNKVSHGGPSHSSVSSQQLQVADHYYAFPDTAVSMCSNSSQNSHETALAYLDGTLPSLPPRSIIHVPLRTCNYELSGMRQK